MIHFSFKAKLALAMMLLVSGITAATLWVGQQKLEAANQRAFDQEFHNEVALFRAAQQARLGGMREKSAEFARAKRLFAAIEDWNRDSDPDTADALYRTAKDNFDASSLLRANAQFLFYRFIDGKGAVVPPPAAIRNGPPGVDSQLAGLKDLLKDTEQEIGYLPLGQRQRDLYEVVVTKIVDSENTNRIEGAMILGLPQDQHEHGQGAGDVRRGLLINRQLYSTNFTESAKEMIVQKIDSLESVHNSGDHQRTGTWEGSTRVNLSGTPHMLFYRALNPGSHLPPAWQISLHSMSEAEEQKKDLRRQVMLFGALAMAIALVFSLLLSQGLTGSIKQLVGGTEQIREGNFNVRIAVRSRDEIGQLTESFNGMAEGLALKEKYRSILDVTQDKDIAEELIQGKIALGGEERYVSVLFCDIRGFTALTEHMEPPEVIKMLNEHFTPLARVVREHHGVVDKFVGDLIMAIFGAPKAVGDNAQNAVCCALAMIHEREQLNASSKYQIAIGIGVGSGQAVAGNMGSERRLNYTVLGPRVNLASRLCGQAGRMEVIVDEETFAAVRGRASAVPLEPLKLKGFATPMPAYKILEFREISQNQAHEVEA